ncbi:MAG: YibE/F family protein [Acidimicrobiia bacterium]
MSGCTTEESLLLTLVPGQLDIRGLVLSGVVLGALGAIDDVTVTQASAVWELRAAAPTMQHGQLFRAGLRIGRDHVASTVNTLALAYAGASMPLLVLFVLTEQPLGIVANSETVTTEILRTLVGSIGLVACVPITTWLAVRLAPTPEPTRSG